MIDAQVLTLFGSGYLFGALFGLGLGAVVALRLGTAG